MARYVVLAGDEEIENGGDDSDHVTALLVNASNETEAASMAKELAKTLGLNILACHDGSAVYRVFGR
jgi:hypothetical protein